MSDMSNESKKNVGRIENEKKRREKYETQKTRGK
jgi:hypothetical protein